MCGGKTSKEPYFGSSGSYMIIFVRIPYVKQVQVASLGDVQDFLEERKAFQLKLRTKVS